MSNFIEEIHRKLASYPQARVEFDASSITVVPDSSDGFTVRLSVQSQEAGEHYTVSYNGCRAILFEHPMQLRHFHPGQTLVIEVEIHLRLAGRALLDALALKLVEEAGLARAAHPDHGMGLARHGGQPRVAPRCGGQFRADAVGEFLAYHVCHGVLMLRILPKQCVLG
jgi:hypothetical protein